MLGADLCECASCFCDFSASVLTQHCLMQVEYDPDVTGPRAMLSAVDDIGFEAELITDKR